MADLYLYRTEEKNHRDFWKKRLFEILETEYSLKGQEIVFLPDGKPVLKSGKKFFNVSHSRDILAIALCDSQIGVDIEFYGRKISENLKRYCLTTYEQDNILESDDRAFLKIWTAKESYLKLCGTGLKESMQNFSVLNDRFRSDLLTTAYFSRLDEEEFTVCIATERQEKLQLKNKLFDKESF